MKIKNIFYIHLIIIAIYCKIANSFNNHKDTNAFELLLQQYANNVQNIWGNDEILVIGPSDYVEYTDQYKTRSYMNLYSGRITIETISQIKPIENIKKALITILLMSNNFKNLDSSLKKLKNKNNIFLFGKVLDNTNQLVQWKWRAQKFAEFILKNKLKKRQSGLNIIWFVTIQLSDITLNKKAKIFLPYVQKAAKKYSIDVPLILAIIQIESNFDPYAISRSHALGLMQIIPNTAGKDVFVYFQRKKSIPTKSYLLDPQNNIDVGTAYLSLLQNIYLHEINNELSKRYVIIAAYNAGVNNILKLFNKDIKISINIINSMPPDDVYHILITKHPNIKLRNYLIKVNDAHENYKNILFKVKNM
ncbi:MAG: membrane-bound lytic murein transglycosylase MltC [Arsenophonus sp.]|nr:MAG: membrane-bound lytic murein transglycosylase MltC [Arsenophonus sp.]